MPNVSRFIIVKAPKDKAAQIENTWRKECGPLMLDRPGCVSEELLRCIEEPGEYISVSEWESRKAIEDYLASPEHEEIKRHTRGITGVAVTVKTYEVLAKE